jgi:L-lactate dehydrogenase complex protein LldF
MSFVREQLERAVSEAIEKPKNRNALWKAMRRGRDTRNERLKTLPGGTAFRDEVKLIKDRCIDDLDALLEEFIANAEKRGCKVYLAKDGPEAIAISVRIAQDRGSRNVSKSKSLTTEEIEINQGLEEAGLSVVETDLGELIIQLVNEKPYHLVFPSVHKLRDEVAEIFTKATGKPVSNDIDEIMKVVRAYLRPIFLDTDIGMTGANIGIAETGGIVIETNEGNGRLVSSIGKCHICVMGIEKVVATVEDALTMVMAHPVSASGQLPTTYVTWMHGRSPLGADGAPRESHLILLDNGRSRMRQDPLMREGLNCIRCGACMNICPTYGVVGGHTFGHIYPGPIGIPWTAEAHGLETAGGFAELCISCGLCKEICPAKIDMPLMIAQVKQDYHKDNSHPLVNRLMMQAERQAKLGSAFAPLSNWLLANGLFRALLENVAGIDRRRVLPPFARRTLAKEFAPKPMGRMGQMGRNVVAKLTGLGARKNSSAPIGPISTRRVVLFHDLFLNHNRPDLGRKAIEKLRALGVEVVVPPQRPCGYPFIAYGNLDAARDVALENMRLLGPWVAKGYEIIATEPTAAYALRVSYPKLLPLHPHSKAVGAATHEFFEYLYTLDTAPSDRLKGKRYGFHCACHQRPLGSGDGAMAWLQRQGANIERIENGTCCGMAGTFGLKHGPLGYDLANAVGEPLFEEFKASAVDAIVTESSVCAIHLGEGTGIPVVHPLELL